jgi:hypothetical protein
VENIDEKTTFRCDATGAGLEGLQPFGTVVVRQHAGSDTLALFLPGQAVSDLQRTRIRINDHGIQVSSPPDPLAVAFEASADSVHEVLDTRISARSDSVDELKDLAATLEDSAAGLSTTARRRVQHSADSARTIMRAMVDRMEADQARMKALGDVRGLSVGQRDSLARLGPQLRDSVRAEVARELARMQAELKQTLPEAVPAQPKVAPAPPVPPARP